MICHTRQLRGSGGLLAAPASGFCREETLLRAAAVELEKLLGANWREQLDPDSLKARTEYFLEHQDRVLSWDQDTRTESFLGARTEYNLSTRTKYFLEHQVRVLPGVLGQSSFSVPGPSTSWSARTKYNLSTRTKYFPRARTEYFRGARAGSGCRTLTFSGVQGFFLWRRSSPAQRLKYFPWHKGRGQSVGEPKPAVSISWDPQVEGMGQAA